MSETGAFAFTVHPRARLREDLARAWRPLGLVPERVYDTALRRLPLPPVTMAGVQIGGERVGHVVLVPFGARHLLSDIEEGRRRVSRAVDRAAALGADVVGLGALTATVTAGGLTLRERTDIAVTNGNAFTAAIVEDQIRMLLPHVSSRTGRPHVAIVGATGSVGTAVTKLLARDSAGARVTLIARTEGRLKALAAAIADDVDVDVAQTIDAVRDADLVVLLTASADTLLGPEHLATGAVVLDATQPRNTSPTLASARPDVLVVDGGIVSIPSLRLTGGEIGLPDGRSYACFAETAILALSGHSGHFSLGNPTLEQVDVIRERARGLARLGFHAAEPTSFGRPVALEAHSAVIA
ncbi:NAD(P)H-binding protein [Microbacterium sp. QXD-8]|uniref:NAD(P)H-binding protein n=1 Tax=Microbacterium psychrotolerans TaxID=3068321 RepID=A0ABU0Z742_9MICO|nr:NAD(P)H-binding protein [Microbacterium sp. QXD-8]MDQ7880423.1 NAD(P)H-binding protein [Microbacterium sp. QXD-8]